MYFLNLFFLIIFVIKIPFNQARNFPSIRARHQGARIINGTEARAGQFPFMAAINVETSNSAFFCGGALISNQWVLTAGQCVDGATNFQIQLGSDTLSGDDDNRLIVSTSDYVLHPDFNPETLANDIGLIHLRMSIRFTDYIKSIYLPYQFLDGGQSITAVGWGQTSDSSSGYSQQLQFVNLNTLIGDWCEEYFGEQIVESMVCAADNYNGGTCFGDSGGPLVQYNNASNTAWHAGIASFFSGNGCESTDPSGFTRTFYFREWLRNVTNI